MYGVYPEAEALNHSSQVLNVMSLSSCLCMKHSINHSTSHCKIWEYFDVMCYSGVKQYILLLCAILLTKRNLSITTPCVGMH